MNILLLFLTIATPVEIVQETPLQPPLPEVHPKDFLQAVGPLDFPCPIVQRIVIRGNDLTRESIIRREVTFAPGDTLSTELIEETRAAIRSIGAFSRVDIVARDAGEGKTDAVINVDEIRFPLPYPTIGVDASSGWYAGGGALYPNLAGLGLHVDAGGDVGFKFRTTPRYRWYTTFELPLTYNRWHGERLGYEFTHRWRKDAAIFRGKHQGSFRQDIRPWRPLIISLEAGWLAVYAYGRDSLTPLPTFSPDTLDRSAYIMPIIELDFRDDAGFPTRGVHVVGSFMYNPGLTEHYPTQRACSLSVAGYVPLGKTVLAGNIWTYQQIDSIPVYNTLYLGNARIVRGWADTTQVGQCLTVASVELRRWLAEYPLPFLGDLKLQVGGNVFFDIGAAHDAGLPPMYLADTRGDTHDGFLAGTGFGFALGAAGFSLKFEIAYGIGAETGAISFIPIPIRFPVYFGWRF
jgi:outer membrane protein assembly factor BamA